MRNDFDSRKPQFDDQQVHPRHAAPGEPGPDATERPKARPTMLEQMGGTTGLVYTMLPIVAFVLVNSSLNLLAATCTAIAVAVAVSVLRLVRKEPVQPALSGLFGVAVASFVSYQTGSAKDFFLVGIWVNAALALAFLASVLMRRPLAGVVWGALNGTEMRWVHDKQCRRYYSIATLAMVAVFTSRFAVQQWLYVENATGWLAFARIAMGAPLLGLGFLVVLWAARRCTKRLKALDRAAAAPQS